jgi:hypothetical protein
VLPLMVRTLGSASVAELYGGTTLVVQAFDLGLFVPLVPFTAVTVHRRMVAGYVMSAIVVVNGVALGIGIAAMLVIEYLATDALQRCRSLCSWPRLPRVASWRYVSFAASSHRARCSPSGSPRRSCRPRSGPRSP